jgi:hypothetical protein
MAAQSPTQARWQIEHDRPEQPEEEGRAERLATWIIVYLTALLTSLAVGGSAWALGLAA